MAEFLCELLTEEIPARMQVRAGQDIAVLFDRFMIEAGVEYVAHDTGVHSTPRRLVILHCNLPSHTQGKSEEKKGPRVGSADAAIQGFLKSTGLSKIDDAEIRKSEKGDFYFATIHQPAKPVAEILPIVIQKIVAQMDWPKSMRWSGGNKTWVRPLRGIMAVFDHKPLPVQIDFGGGVAVRSANHTSGHRFMAANAKISVLNFDEYRKKLFDAKVFVERSGRKDKIEQDLVSKAAAIGLTARPDDALLDEVAGLVEWPVVLIGTIDPQFMSVPDRVLITSMRQHQKYFALLNADGALSNKFAFVANIEAKDGGDTVVAGNERVLRARLHDAKFFFEQDQKMRLEDRLPKLKDIVFHAKLGSIGQKVERLSNIAKALADKFGADPIAAFDAAILCKADLTTGMVGEFPELQGYMGGAYAKIEGESDAVVDAIANHYRPLGPNDEVPQSPLAATLALADKIDSLVGFFMVGEKPTGSKDPFALRRACLGIIRIILEKNGNIPLRPLIGLVYQNYAEHLEDIAMGEDALCDEVMEFFFDRLKVYLKDEQKIRHDVVASVLSISGESDLRRIVKRASAVSEFLGADSGAALLASYRRAANIVKAEVAKDKKEYAGDADSRLLQQDAEIKVFDAIQKTLAPAKRLVDQAKFAEAMQTLALLALPLNQFFDQVKVNTDDAELRANRLRLLNQIRSTVDLIADFSRIEG